MIQKIIILIILLFLLVIIQQYNIKNNYLKKNIYLKENNIEEIFKEKIPILNNEIYSYKIIINKWKLYLKQKIKTKYCNNIKKMNYKCVYTYLIQ